MQKVSPGVASVLRPSLLTLELSLLMGDGDVPFLSWQNFLIDTVRLANSSRQLLPLRARHMARWKARTGIQNALNPT